MSQVLWLAPCAAVLALAAFLRLRQPGLTEMGNDQALMLNIALGWVNGGPLPLASIKSSFGVTYPPMVEYVYALPLFFKPDLMGVVWMTGAANLLGLVAVGLAAGRVFGWRVAIWAGLLSAVSPWAVYYSRLIWNPTLVPLFAGLLLACWLLYFSATEPKPGFWERRGLLLASSGFWLAGAVQVHMTSVVLGLVGLALALIFWRRLRLVPLLAAILLFTVTFWPYVVYLQATGFADVRALGEGLSGEASFSAAPLRIVLNLIQAEGIYNTLGRATDLYHAAASAPSADRAAAVLFFASVAHALWVVASAFRSGSRRSKRKTSLFLSIRGGTAGLLVLLLWLLIPILAFSRFPHYLQSYYFLPAFPAAYLLIACLTDAVYKVSAARLRLLLPPPYSPGIASLVFLPLLWISASYLRVDLVGQNLRAAGVSGRERVVDVQRALEAARRLMSARPDCAFVVVSDGTGFETSRFALFSAWLDPARARFVGAGGATLVPDPCAVYFLASDQPGAADWLRAHARPLPDETVHTPEETWRFYDLPVERRLAVLADWSRAGVGRAWENGLILQDARIVGEAARGGALILELTWQVTRNVGGQPIHFGHYLVNAEGAVVTQVDGPGVDSASWEIGDWFRARFVLPLPADMPPGDYSLEVAQYHWPSLDKIPLADGQELLDLDVVTVKP